MDKIVNNKKGITVLQLILLIILFILIILVIANILAAKDRLVARSKKIDADYGYLNYGTQVERVRNNILLKYDEKQQSLSLEQLAHEMEDATDWILSAYVYMNDKGEDEYINVVTQEGYKFHVYYDWISRADEKDL